MKISYGHKKNVQPKKKTLADVRNERARAEKKKAANSCIVELSDRTTYCLSAEKLDAVFQAGLKACGYIEDQEIKKIAWNSDMCCAR